MAPRVAPRSGCPGRPALPCPALPCLSPAPQGTGSNWKNLPGTAQFLSTQTDTTMFALIYTSGCPWPSATVKSPGFFKLGSCFSFFFKLLTFLFFYFYVFFLLLLFCIVKIKCFFFTFIYIFIWMQVWSLEKEDTPHSFSSRVFLQYL